VWFGVPYGLRQLDFFRLRRIEIEGLRYLPPSEILAAFAAADSASLFDGWDGHRDRVLALGGVVDVAVARRLPGTLVLTVVETAPVALSPGEDGMVLVAADGSILPYEPLRSAPDLPVLFEADSVAAGLLHRIRETSPTLFARISTMQAERGDVLVVFDRGRLRLRPDASAGTIRAIEAVERDLIDRGHRYTELDGRFADQVVVRGGAA